MRARVGVLILLAISAACASNGSPGGQLDDPVAPAAVSTTLPEAGASLDPTTSTTTRVSAGRWASTMVLTWPPGTVTCAEIENCSAVA